MRHTVSLERNGKQCTGAYEITGTPRTGEMIEVWYGEHSKRTQLGNPDISPEPLARILLGELVNEYPGGFVQ